MILKNYINQEEPLEKLLEKGCGELTDVELMSILMGSGSKNENVKELAKRILDECDNNLQNLARYSVSNLKKFKGVGNVKAVKILAALEFGKRAIFQKKTSVIKESYDIFSQTRGSLGGFSHEEFWVFYLDRSNKILKKLVLSKGGLTGTIVDVRLLMKNALELMATGIVICHNHPSGNIQPSLADKKITNKIKTACEAMDIRILDHVIVTQMAYYSFADEGIL